MPKGSEELTNARKNEIVSACAELYERMSFKEITIKEIGEATSFTRTSIYNYFQTKEEIFLALFAREYEAWREDLERIINEHDALSPQQFASCLADTLSGRGRLLRLLSMNLYDMEESSRMERLAEFKRSYGKTIDMLTLAVRKFFPSYSDKDVHDRVFLFIPFIFGVYPYVHITPKQKEAMEEAGIECVLFPSIRDMVYSFAIMLFR